MVLLAPDGTVELANDRAAASLDVGPEAMTGRHFSETGHGPIRSWEQFESYPWPDPDRADLWAYQYVAKKLPDGSLDYGMGFDEARDEDLSYNCEGIEVVFQPEYGPLLSGAVLDYVEMEPGQYQFIFMNPNDPNYKPPEGGPAPESQSN